MKAKNVRTTFLTIAKGIVDIFLTVTANAHVKYIADLNIDNAKKALALLFELFLVKYLNCNNTLILGLANVYIIFVIDISVCIDNKSRVIRYLNTYTSKLSFQYGFKVFFMTVVVCVCSPSTVTTAIVQE